LRHAADEQPILNHSVYRSTDLVRVSCSFKTKSVNDATDDISNGDLFSARDGCHDDAATIFSAEESVVGRVEGRNHAFKGLFIGI